MARLAVDKVMQLFPKNDEATPKFLFFLVTDEKKRNAIPFVIEKEGMNINYSFTDFFQWGL